METGTFLQENVSSYINEHFVPLKFVTGADEEKFRNYNIRATPTFLVLDQEGKELSRVVGFYNADEFIDQMDTVVKSV